MFPYILLYSIIWLFPITRVLFKDARKYKNRYCAWIFVSVILILGLRHPSMGNDLAGYLKSFDRLTDLSWKELFSLDSYLNYEWGYIVFNKVIGDLSFKNDQILLIVCALLSTVPVWITIRLKSEDILMSTVVYLGLPIFILQFSGLRQCIAIGICFISLRFIEQKKFWKFSMLILLASTFHTTSLLFILAFFLYHLKIPDKIRWFTLLLFPIIFVFRKQIFLFFVLIFMEDASLQQTNAITMMLVFAMIYLFLLIVCYQDCDEQTNGYLNIFLFACLCMIFTGIYSTAIRVAYYFMISLILLLPIAMNKLKKKLTDVRWIIFIRYVIIICFILFAFDNIRETYWAKAYPYHVFWEKMY